MNFLLNPATMQTLCTFFGALCIALLIYILREGRKIQDVQGEKQALLGKISELDKIAKEADSKFQRHLAELTAQKDEHIQRQEKQIVGLHKENLRLRDELKTHEDVADRGGMCDST